MAKVKHKDVMEAVEELHDKVDAALVALATLAASVSALGTTQDEMRVRLNEIQLQVLNLSVP